MRKVTAEQQRAIVEAVKSGRLTMGQAGAISGLSAVHVMAMVQKRTAERMRERNKPNWLRRLLLGDPDSLRKWLG